MAAPTIGIGFRAKAKPGRRLHVVRRQSPDWSNPDKRFWQGVVAFEGFMALAPGSTKQMFDMWDATARIPFFEFREKVAAITNRNLERLGGTDLINFHEFRKSVDADAMYVFIDDDDFFSPELPETLLTHEVSGVGATWRYASLYSGLTTTAAKDICATNNYGLRGDALRKDLYLRRISEQHFAIDHAVRGRQYRMDYIDRSLSVANKHPASTVVLTVARQRYGEAGARRAIDDFKRGFDQPIDLLSRGLDWARPEIDAMRRLVELL